MAKDYGQLAEGILACLGGKDNVTFASHCMTRLRLVVRDEGKIDEAALKKVKGVLGAQSVGGQYQVIIGQDVNRLYPVFLEKTGLQSQPAVDENPDAAEKKPLTPTNVGSAIMDAITGSLTPIIPVLLIAGMVKMFVAVLGPTMLGLITEESDLYIIWSMLGDACFYFFPALVGYTAAKKFGCSEVLGVLMGCVLISPTLNSIVEAGEPFSVYGIPMRLVSYGSTVIPIILITWVMSHVERLLKKYVPSVLSTIFVPLLEVLIMLPLALCVLGPLGAYLGDFVCNILFGIHDVFGALGVAIIGAAFPPLVVTGMHVPLNAAVMLSFTNLGYDATVFPGAMMSVYASMAVSLAFALKCKDADDKSLGISCFVAQALGGVGEPQLYGISLRYKQAFASLIAGTFCGALWQGIMGNKMYFPAASNAIAVLGFNGGNAGEFFSGCIGAAIAFAVTFALMMVFFKDPSAQESDGAEPVALKSASRPAAKAASDAAAVCAPVSGKVEQTASIPDPVFAGEAMGKTVAIWPEEGVVYAPVSGTVTTAMPHALGIMGDNGAEVLVHIGVDTVAMEGDGFTTWVSAGDVVKAGEAVVSFDRDKVKKAGHPDIVMTIITNSDDLAGLAVTAGSTAEAGSKVMSL